MKSEAGNGPFGKISAPAHRALAGAGIVNLEQLCKLGEAELMKLHELGKNGLQTLKATLADAGLRLKA